MQNDRLINELNSEEAFPSRRQTPADDSSEEEFLAAQAVSAKAAMRRTAREIKQTLLRAMRIGDLAATHPWILTASAVAAGCVAGIATAPRSQCERTPPDSKSVPPQPADLKPEAVAPEPSFLSSTLKAAFAGLVKTAAMNILSAIIISARQAETRESMKRGETDAASTEQN